MAADSSRVRPGASPSQKGRLGGWPFASATRTTPGSTRSIAPGRVAELEDVAAVALDRPVLVDRADHGAFGLQADLVVGGVGDGAPGHEGHQPRALRGPQPLARRRRGGGAPCGRCRRAGAPPRRTPRGARSRYGQARFTASNSGSSSHVPGTHSATTCWARMSSGRGRGGGAVEQRQAHAAQERGRLHQLVGGEREDAALRDAARERVAGAARPAAAAWPPTASSRPGSRGRCRRCRCPAPATPWPPAPAASPPSAAARRRAGARGTGCRDGW